jgi:GcrA cell cycle regulator
MDENADKPLMIPLLDLEDRMCRWPIGDPRDKIFGFCGHCAVRGKPYCKHHQDLAWNTQRVVIRARKAPMNLARAA